MFWYCDIFYIPPSFTDALSTHKYINIYITSKAYENNPKNKLYGKTTVAGKFPMLKCPISPTRYLCKSALHFATSLTCAL